MGVNLMEGRLDGDDNNDKKPAVNEQKNENKIDLTLEKPSVNQPNKSTQVPNPTQPAKPIAKEIKVKVPADIKTVSESPMETSSSGSLKIVIGIVSLLVVGAGVLLFLLNSESQNLKGSVNEIPETNSTQIVDDILAEDFSNEVDNNAAETETVDSSESETEAEDVTVDTPEENSSELEVIGTDEPEDMEVEELEEDAPLVIEEGDTEQEGPVIVENNNGIVIDEYELQSSSDVTNELISSNDTSQEVTDFTQAEADPSATVVEQVGDSEEIQGETGPALWLSVIIATLISFAYARKNDEQLG